LQGRFYHIFSFYLTQYLSASASKTLHSNAAMQMLSISILNWFVMILRNMTDEPEWVYFGSVNNEPQSFEKVWSVFYRKEGIFNSMGSLCYQPGSRISFFKKAVLS
jgi:hypothetical protein